MSNGNGKSSLSFLRHDWIRPLARFGYASRGAVYLIIGFFAMLSGLGPSANKDSKVALRTILEQPFGKALVAILIVGLIGYVIWRLIQSLLDTDAHGFSFKGLAVRAGLLASAATYAILATYALSLVGLLAFTRPDSSVSIADRIAGMVGTKPVLIVMLLVFAGAAIAHWYKAATRRYADHIDTNVAPMNFVHPIAMAGLFARGCVFAIIALLLFYRVRSFAPSETEPPGLLDALQFVQQLSLGDLLLTALGLGLILFAGYSFCEALWRNINVEDAAIEEQLE